MSASNVVETEIVVGTASQLALAANVNRLFLEIQNKSNNILTIKAGVDFIPAASGVQKISFNRVPTGGNYTLTYGGQETTELAYNADATAVQTALRALSSIGSGNITVTGNYTAGFTCTFAGTLANTTVTAIAINENTLKDNTVVQDAVQNINFSGPPASGAFVLSFKGSSTGSLAWNISAANLMTALNALPTINGGVGAVAQDPISKNFAVDFSGAPLTNSPQPLIGVVSSTLLTNQNQSTGVSKLYAAPAPQLGTYKLMCGAYTTTALAYGALAATIQAALEALTNIGAGNVLVAAIGVDGDLVAGYTITYQGSLANTTMPDLIPTESNMDVLGISTDKPSRPALAVVDTIIAQGPGSVTTTIVNDNVGVAPADVAVTLSITTVGHPVDDQGIDIQARQSWVRDENVPVDAIYMRASDPNTDVVILEG